MYHTRYDLPDLSKDSQQRQDTFRTEVLEATINLGVDPALDAKELFQAIIASPVRSLTIISFTIKTIK